MRIRFFNLRNQMEPRRFNQIFYMCFDGYQQSLDLSFMWLYEERLLVTLNSSNQIIPCLNSNWQGENRPKSWMHYLGCHVFPWFCPPNGSLEKFMSIWLKDREQEIYENIIEGPKWMKAWHLLWQRVCGSTIT